MTQNPAHPSILRTSLTLAIAVGGALAGWALNAPVFMLVGPAVAVTLAGLGGIETAVDPRLRDLCFVFLGLAVGAGFNTDALAAMVKWPLAFVFMGAVLWLILVTCRILLIKVFQFEPRAALLAAAPGHLSFVLAVAAEIKSDVGRISITQSVRLLSLTITVPFVALALGVEVSGTVVPTGQEMSLVDLVVLAGCGVALGLVFKRFAVPAYLLMGAMVASALGHLTEWAPGFLPLELVLPAYLVLGALIGTRFSGVSLQDVRQGLGAGVMVTLVAVVFASLAALPVAWGLDMPVAHVLVAFAPGGLETMIAMGGVLGVVPGFVAACHIARLFVLSFLVPYLLARENRL